MMEIVRLALEEDIGPGDVTSKACVPEDCVARATFLARETLVLGGVEVLQQIFPEITLLKHDGDVCHDGDIIARVEGNARLLLERERVSLNFLQRLSGVASLARQFAEAVAGSKCRVLDTRKTTPGMRILEKRAAAAGGITNHRVGLFDAILIKNNHIAAAGSLREAVLRAREQSPLPIEAEVRTLAELEEALACGVSHLLLDNLTPAEAADWIRQIEGRATVELSGGINLRTVRAYADTGADFVSAGVITHSARSMDISLRLELL
ncbi:MAG TPA: carboxylating nicotinate-nucleotide diphosphorylase [Bryobacteraceae bacterium]|nr:carboxylating nicotinate-nucleotide diphosphorylase [Bryobacteraceae bacterium]